MVPHVVGIPVLIRAHAAQVGQIHPAPERLVAAQQVLQLHRLVPGVQSQDDALRQHFVARLGPPEEDAAILAGRSPRAGKGQADGTVAQFAHQKPDQVTVVREFPVRRRIRGYAQWSVDPLMTEAVEIPLAGVPAEVRPGVTEVAAVHRDHVRADLQNVVHIPDRESVLIALCDQDAARTGAIQLMDGKLPHPGRAAQVTCLPIPRIEGSSHYHEEEKGYSGTLRQTRPETASGVQRYTQQDRGR